MLEETKNFELCVLQMTVHLRTSRLVTIVVVSSVVATVMTTPLSIVASIVVPRA